MEDKLMSKTFSSKHLLAIIIILATLIATVFALTACDWFRRDETEDDPAIPGVNRYQVTANAHPLDLHSIREEYIESLARSTERVGFDMWFFHLGTVRNVPISSSEPLFFDGQIAAQRSFTTSETTSTSVTETSARAVQNTSQVTRSASETEGTTRTLSATVGAEVSARGAVFSARASVSATASDTWSATSTVGNSRTIGGSVSVTNTYTYLDSLSLTESDTITHAFSVSSPVGYYRLSRFVHKDVFIVIGRDRDNEDRFYYEFYTFVQPNTTFVSVDFSADLPFGRSDDLERMLVFDDGMLDNLGEPSEVGVWPGPGPQLPEIRPQVAAGNLHSLALDSQGNVWAWGNGQNGRLGHGGTGTEQRPRMITGVAGFNNIIAISAGGAHSMALDANGNVWTWGNGGNGRLGHGGNVDENHPRMITGILGFSNIIAISAGNAHSMALDRSGNVWTWGHGGSGRLGHGGTNNEYRPRIITVFNDILAITAGSGHSMALDEGGNVWTWGSGTFGYLGHGGIVNELRPRMIVGVAGFNGITAISAGTIHSMALDGQGNVWTWGNGGNGRLGHGGTAQENRPRMITGITSFNRIMEIKAGHDHNIALDESGNVWTWGSSMNGRLGHGGTANETRPRMITGVAELNSITAIDVGSRHSITVDTNGNIWTWGHGGSGELGHGNNTTQTRPRRIEGVGL